MIRNNPAASSARPFNTSRKLTLCRRRAIELYSRGKRARRGRRFACAVIIALSCAQSALSQRGLPTSCRLSARAPIGALLLLLLLRGWGSERQAKPGQAGGEVVRQVQAKVEAGEEGEKRAEAAAARAAAVLAPER